MSNNVKVMSRQNSIRNDLPKQMFPDTYIISEENFLPFLPCFFLRLENNKKNLMFEIFSIIRNIKITASLKANRFSHAMNF
jgi:hypothetical protein